MDELEKIMRVEDHSFDAEDASHFLEMVRLSTSTIIPQSSSKPNVVVFRGQSDATWNLTPSAFRNDGTVKLAGITNLEDAIKEEGLQKNKNYVPSFRVMMERKALALFVEYADGIGIHIPKLDLRIRQSLIGSLKHGSKMLTKEDIDLWPYFEILEATPKGGFPILKYEFFELLSIVQHNGIPTRLLDWTDNPLVAAFIAAEDILTMKQNEQEIPQDLSVWCLNIDWENYVPPESETVKRGRIEPYIPFDIIRVPSTYSRRLNAQGGLFIYCQSIETPWFGTENPPGLEKVASESRVTEHPMLIKVRLDTKYAGELLRLLDRDGINAATVYPDYQGVMRQLEIRRLINNYIQMIASR